MTHSRGILCAVSWGCLLATWVSRGFFVPPEDEIHASHENYAYVYRLIEFRDCLWAGYLSPQWCSNFRCGLGQPFFNYYQPGFFYVASLIASSLMSDVKVLGVAVWIFSLIGYLGLLVLGCRFFGLIGGVFSGSMLLLSVYSGTELYVRGDLTEYGAMMLFAPLLCAVSFGLEQPSRLTWMATALLGGAMVSLHPCIALVGYGVLVIGAFAHSLTARQCRNTCAVITALGAGGCAAAFYWVPIVLEWKYVNPDSAFAGFFHYSNNFISPSSLYSDYSRKARVPFTLGVFTLLVLAFNTVWLCRVWRKLKLTQRRVVLQL